MRIRAFTFIICLLSLNSFAQTDFRGIWQGYITASQMSLISEYTLNVKTQNKNIISGTAYLYRKEDPLQFDGVLDFIADVKGDFVSITELTIIKEVPPTKYHSICIKSLSLELTKKDSSEYLVGKWTNMPAGGDCIPGKAYLKRYVPDDNHPLEKLPSVILEEIKKDSVNYMTLKNTKLSEPVIIDVYNRDLKLEFTDYMKEDNDTVSVYVNRVPFIEKLRIRKTPTLFNLKLSRNIELNELVLYAVNLGFVPPNTCNLIIHDGTKKHKLSIVSTKQTSAVIYLRYKGYYRY